MEGTAQGKQTSKNVVFERPHHFSALDNMRENGVMCDVTIEVGNQSFRGHRLVLAATINFFKKKFTINFGECIKEVLTLKDIKPENMEAIIKFAYSGRITLTEDNVQDLIKDSEYLGLTDVRDACAQFLKNYPSNEKANIYVLNTQDPTIMEIYNPHTGTWETSSTTITDRVLFSATVHKGKLYTVGGLVDLAPASNVAVYDTQNKIWKTIAPLNNKRRSPGVASLDHYVYVCGGCGSSNLLNSAERYDPDTDEWKTLRSMNHSRIGPVVIGLKGSIYALGGSDGESPLDYVERYDPQNDEWTVVDSPMKEKRQDFGAAVLNGKLYVCGGTGSPDGASLKTVEVYDPEAKSWEYVADMNNARWSLLVVATMGKLWAIGGYEEVNPNTTVEVYDPETNSWSYGPSLNKLGGEVTGGVESI